MTVAPDFGENLVPTTRRAHRRLRLFLPATLESVVERQSADLRSLSCGGAMLTVARPPRIGSDVILKCGPYEWFGQAVWTGRDEVGIAFEEPLTDECVLTIRRIADNHPETIRAHRLAAARAWAEGRC